MKRILYIVFFILCALSFSPVVAAQEIEYGMTRKTYEIAGIEVEGADSYEDFVLIGFSGLAIGDKIEVPGDQITKSIKRFWNSVRVSAKCSLKDSRKARKRRSK